MSNKIVKKALLKSVARSKAPQQVRIIGGQWKRTPLAVADLEGLRPTPDRVRETAFNWLTHLLEGHWEQVRCLDLFAGTGAMGFEAASRGAPQVTMVESHAAAVRQMQATKEKLKAQQVEIMRGDAVACANALKAQGAKKFDLIFLDPPYHMGWLEKTLPLCEALLNPSGMVYAESEYSLAEVSGLNELNWLESWSVVRADKAGMVYFHLLQLKQIQA